MRSLDLRDMQSAPVDCELGLNDLGYRGIDTKYEIICWLAHINAFKKISVL